MPDLRSDAGSFAGYSPGSRAPSRYGVLRDRVRDRNLESARLRADHLSPERRDQSRVSPTSQRRGGVPCKRLIRDSAGLAALALVNQAAREPFGDGSRSSQGFAANASVRRWPREEERGSQFPDSG